MSTVFFAFRDAPERRAALGMPGSLDRYRLFGMDELAGRGVVVRHNLERPEVPRWARAAGTASNAVLDATGRLGGDFGSVLASLRVANSADVVFATVDTVGIPVLWLKRLGLIRPPVVYAAIGLPQRLARLRSRSRLVHAVRAARTLITYAAREADELRQWVGAAGPSIAFVPFGVDVDAFRPVDEQPRVDVVSIGADPMRDFPLLVEVARRHPEWSFLIVGTAERIRTLGPLPENVATEADLPLEAVRARLAVARVVALPVRDNSYSGATTTLLQAMAMAKPVVVSRTEAIVDGYGLVDGENCRLVPPGDVDAFERALAETTTGAGAAIALGTRARETVVGGFSWERYVEALWAVLFPAT